MVLIPTNTQTNTLNTLKGSSPFRITNKEGVANKMSGLRGEIQDQ